MIQPHKFSWYLGTVHPRSIMIGDKGYDCPEWKELEPVASPEEWWRNGFYMDAECRCVMNRHNLERFYDSRTAKKETTRIHYSNISYEVPGYPHSATTSHVVTP